MAIAVQFDEKVSRLAGGAPGTEAAGRTVRDALIQVARAYPSLHLFNCDGELRSIIRLRRNNEPAGLDDALGDGDTLLLTVA